MLEFVLITDAITFLVETINNQYPISENGTRVSVIFYDTNEASKVLSLTEGTTLSSVNNVIQTNINNWNPTSSLSEGMSAARDEFQEHSRYYQPGSDYDTFMILITVINSPIDNNAINTSSELKSEHINVIAIDVSTTNAVSEHDLQAIASNSEDAIHVSPDELAKLWKNPTDLKKKICPYPGNNSEFEIY